MIPGTSLKLSLLPLTAALSLRLFAQAPYPPAPDTRTSANRPTAAELKDPPRSWIDPETGHRVIRLTDQPGSASFYFNVNAYTPNGQEMVYTTPDGISVFDLKTFKTRSVVQGHVWTVVAGHKTPSIFYVKPEDHALYVTDVDTGETRKLAGVPEHGSIASINADETVAVGTYDESPASGQRPPAPGKPVNRQTSPLEQAANKGDMMVKRLAARTPVVLFTLNLDNGKVTPLLHSTDWIGHMLFSPTDPTLLMYCHEGPWQAVDRIWTIRTDGTHNRLMHQRHMAMEIAGHEFWGWDGQTIYYDLQTPKGQDFFLASVNLNSGERRWYHLDRNEWSIHFNVSKDGSLFAGDGGDPGQVAKAADGEWLYLFHPELIKNIGIADAKLINPGVVHAEKLVKMSKHNYALEPNVSFTPDQKMIIFRSNMFGPTYVFGVEVDRAVNP